MTNRARRSHTMLLEGCVIKSNIILVSIKKFYSINIHYSAFICAIFQLFLVTDLKTIYEHLDNFFFGR